MIIECEVPLALFITSKTTNLNLPNINIRISRELNANAKFVGEVVGIDEEESKKYGGLLSYARIRTVIYAIKVESADKYKKAPTKDALYKLLEEDILKIHNRVVDVLRARLDCWRLKPLAFSDHSTSFNLSSLKTKYKYPNDDIFTACEHTASFQDILHALEGSSNSESFIEANNLPELSEWLEENNSISVASELLAQAREAQQEGNLRLAILNYITALEQVLNKCLASAIKNKLGGTKDEKTVRSFLNSNGTKFEDRINILLPMLVHESWLMSIDLKVITRAITIRNKVAHGETIKVIDRYADIDWTAMFKNLNNFIRSLESCTVLLEASPEIKDISTAVLDKHGVLIDIWVHKMHKITCEITSYGDPIKEPEWIEEIVKTISEIRSKQDNKFNMDQHLSLSIFTAPKHIFAKWNEGTIQFIE